MIAYNTTLKIHSRIVTQPNVTIREMTAVEPVMMIADPCRGPDAFSAKHVPAPSGFGPSNHSAADLKNPPSSHAFWLEVNSLWNQSAMSLRTSSVELMTMETCDHTDAM